MPHIGQIEYHLVSDGVTWLDGGGTFGVVPRTIWAKMMPPDEDNRIPLALHCLLVKVAGKTILVDTGLGDKLSQKHQAQFGLIRSEGGLLENLANVGIQPEDVDIVINTHLHADHCGGNTAIDPKSKRIVPTFPNAEYWIQRLELADATYPNERTRSTYYADNFSVLQETGQLKVVSGDTDVFAGIRTVTTRGHTRSHQCIIIESEGDLGFFVADLASNQIALARTAWVSAYDVEPLETIESKRYWQHWAAENQAAILFQHDAQLKTARLHREGKFYTVEALDPPPSK
ncbi:MAG: MBL fold metallo-hydrolase [Chloroflexota bacterium]